MAYLIYREHRVLQEVNLFQEAGYPHVDKRTVYGVRQVRLIKIKFWEPSTCASEEVELDCLKVFCKI